MKLRRRLLILCFVLTLGACSQAATDYAKELTGLKIRITELGKPATKDEALQLISYRYRFASLSGDYADFKAVEDSINDALQAHGPGDDLYYFSAHLNFKLHRLPAAQSSISLMRQDDSSLSLQALRADLALQQGRYAEALQGYENLNAAKRSWDALARLAYYRLKTGQPEMADELYRQAADLIPAKDMRSYAWVELQRGLIDLEYGRYAPALEHYRLADRAYSGYWLIEEHIAEVMHLLGRDKDAIELYRKIIDRTHNPEFVTALANILTTSEPAEAAALYRDADIFFGRQLALYPEAAAGHLIEYLLQKPGVDPRLQEYAEQNHTLRPNGEAKLLLAKARLKLGDAAAARAMLSEILQTPWRTPAITALATQLGVVDKGSIRGKT